MDSAEHAGNDGQVELVDRSGGEEVCRQDAATLAEHYLAAALAPEPDVARSRVDGPLRRYPPRRERLVLPRIARVLSGMVAA